MGSEDKYLNFAPLFKVSEVHRDETTNELSITAYDAIYQAAALRVNELSIKPPYTIKQFADACGAALGLTVKAGQETAFSMLYNNGANFEGSESIREALNAIAEATQTIYFVDYNQNLVFKRLSIFDVPEVEITKDKYFSLESSTNRKLAKICHATELGDNVIAESSFNGSTQFVRNNPFWDLREDIGTIVEDALAAVGGMTINQFDCSWRGNFLLEIGDKISLTTKDDKAVNAYVLNDVLSYDGSLSQKTKWEYSQDEAETAANPSTIGDALKQTFARVDKVNRQIDLVITDVDENNKKLTKLEMDNNSISGRVQNIEQTTNDSLEAVNKDITKLTEEVNTKLTAQDVKIEISKQLENGVDKVTTSTGFTFDESGLTVSKTGQEMETKITENGMTVSKDSEAVLVANSKGVDAVNLHATTYLIIGRNSRFEDYDDTRTGCFWIGG